MAKQKLKTGRKQRVSKPQGKGMKWTEKVKDWSPVIALAALLLTSTYLTGTNDLFWTGVVLAAILSLSALALLWFVWHKRSFGLTLPEVLLFAFVAWQWLTVTSSVYRWASLLEATRWTVFAATLSLVRSLCDDRHRFWLSVSFVSVTALTALQGIADYALNAWMGNFGWRIFGPFIQPNLFGNFLLLAFFIALGIAFQRPYGLVLLPTFVATLLLTAMALTGSKGALLAWTVGVFVFALLTVSSLTSQQMRKRLWLSAVIVPLTVVALAVFLPPVRERFETLWTSQAHSWVFRLFVWKATFSGSLSRPIMGFGAGTFEWAYPQFTTVGFTRHAHNGFLQTAIESGFVGLLLLLSFLVALVFARPNSPSKPHDLPIHIGSVSAIIAFCLHNLVETAWMTLANLLTLAVVCGIAASSATKRLQIRWQWQLALSLPILIGLWHSVAVFRGAYFAQKARGEPLPSSRLYWLELASDVDPLNARHLIDRAILLEAWAIATGDNYRLREALRLCEKAARLQPTRSGNYKVKARILRELGDLDKAEQALHKALRLNRTDTEAMFKLGELYEEQGKVQKATKVYRRLVTLEKSPYGRYKPVDQWQDIFIAAAKIRLAKHLLRSGERTEPMVLLKEARTSLQSFLEAYLPILKSSDPEAAESQSRFVEALLDEIQRLVGTKAAR